jgi:uncharacterized protein YegL
MKTTDIIYILDRSGSMGGRETDVIGGFNANIAEQRKLAEKLDKEVRVSVVLFDDEVEVLYDRVPLSRVNKMTEDDYYVRGCTALYDAVGSSIDHMINVSMRAKEDGDFLFIINTDGFENASHKYSARQLQQMIRFEEKRFGWEFIFLAANIDADRVASDIGIRASNVSNYVNDRKGNFARTRSESHAIGSFLATGSVAEDSFVEVRQDFKKRGRR